MQNTHFYLKIKHLSCLICLIVCLQACGTHQMMAKKIDKVFKRSDIIKQYHVGFALYDLSKERMIFQKDANIYYTPASNTKLFTYYAGLKIAADSIPSLRYVEQGDSLIFWGTGDPSFLHTVLKGTKAFDFLKNSNKKLFFSPGRYTGSFYANGWQWDDYNEYYQPEINELPLFDNVLLFRTDVNAAVQIMPLSFTSKLLKDSSLNSKSFRVIREYDQNVFHLPSTKTPASYRQQIPYKTSTATTLSLLTDTLHRSIGLSNLKMPSNAKTIFNLNSDSIFKQMLLPSDNFVAEQLLLTYADRLGIELNAGKVISYVEKEYLSSLPDKPVWADGSGLSRSNLFTPRSMVALLELIYKEVNNEQKLFSMLPAGGKSGTLRTAYPQTSNPFVFGKTGSLSNNHNQSGFVRTKKDKVYIFSFMNNSFVMPTAEVRKEMVRIMTYIHNNF